MVGRKTTAFAGQDEGHRRWLLRLCEAFFPLRSADEEAECAAPASFSSGDGMVASGPAGRGRYRAVRESRAKKTALDR